MNEIAESQIGHYSLPAGAAIVMSPYIVHRDPRFFVDPLQFDPERFAPEVKAKYPKFAYFPFSGGLRRCIGEQIAWMEGVLVLATLAQIWQFRLVLNRPLRTSRIVTLRPKYGMLMIVKKW